MSTAARTYRQRARAAAAEAATERILDAAEQIFWENPAHPVPLTRVAELAGVSVHSILRRFGSQQGMLDAAGSRRLAAVAESRSRPVPGDLPQTVAGLVDHYEEMGDRVLSLLVAEEQLPSVKKAVDDGRAMHAEWCEQMFAAALRRRSGADRKRLLAQLIAICDVYTWMLLRRQRGLSRRETERALLELLAPLVNGDAE